MTASTTGPRAIATARCHNRDGVWFPTATRGVLGAHYILATPSSITIQAQVY